MKILLFGAAGQVGTDCARELLNAGYEVLPITRKELDFAQPSQVRKCVLDSQADVIINACAYTAVDRAEEETTLADAVNHLSVAAIAEACRESGRPLIHISTDYVFNGQSTKPYIETDPVSPLGVYGQTKQAGEAAIAAILPEHIILRTSWVFGENGNNFVKTMLRVGAERDQLRVVSDQVGRPTYVGDIVSTIVFFVSAFESDNILPWGIYHCSSDGQVSWYDFACAIFDEAEICGVLNNKPEVMPIPSSDYPTPAPRPAYSVLSTDKLTTLMRSSLPHWQDGLKKFMQHYAQVEKQTNS